MKRSIIEERIIDALKNSLLQMNFVYENSFVSSSNHFYNFRLTKNDIELKVIIRFYNSSFLHYDAVLNLYSNTINEYIKKLNTNQSFHRELYGIPIEERNEFSLFHIRLNSYLHPENKIDVSKGYIWKNAYSEKYCIDGIVDPKSGYVREVEVNDLRLLAVAEDMVQKYFVTAKKLKVNTLSEIKEIFRTGIHSNRIEPLSVCYPFSQQILFGYLLELLESNSLDESLIHCYLHEAQIYGEDDYGYIDFVNKIETIS